MTLRSTPRRGPSPVHETYYVRSNTRSRDAAAAPTAAGRLGRGAGGDGPAGGGGGEAFFGVHRLDCADPEVVTGYASNLKVTIARLGRRAFLLRIPIRSLGSAHELGQPCAILFPTALG
jgi:hypothetical protein